jgi:nondiscriminating glutamyl-tRNA synthetase
MRAMSGSSIVTRFAPSPSGELHLGNARTALFNWLLARRHGGRFLLRIEDTDAQRSRPEFVAALIEDLAWLGLAWDEGPGCGGPSAPYEQSARSAHYASALDRLESLGAVYPCYCSPLELDLSRRAQTAAGRPPRYAGTCRELTPAQRREREAEGRRPTLRFRVPATGRVRFQDLVHGDQDFASADIGDFVVRRADGSAAFFFSNVLDDALMGVTVVLRGEDHLSNTPRQLLLAAALGLQAPAYGHLALIFGEDGSPLSKRHGARSLRQLREEGYLPAAILNHLFRLGHSCPEHGLADASAMAQAFDTAQLGRAPARFDPAQLRSWQKEAVHRLEPDAALAWLRGALPQGLDDLTARAFVAAVQQNVVLPGDAAAWATIVFGDEAPQLDEEGAALLRAAGPGFFAAAVRAVDEHGDDWKAVTAAVRAATSRKGPDLFRPLRYALTGAGHGPELAPLLPLITAARARERLLRFTH